MIELFRGYVPTKNKKCLMAFKNKTSADLMTYEQVSSLSEFAGILNDGVILIDIDDHDESEILMDIVEDMQLRCRVYETTRGKHFLFVNSNVETCRTHAKTAIGLTCDIKLGDKNSYSVLKFDGKEREIIYDKLDDEEYQELPKWLTPVKTRAEFISMEAGDGRNQELFNYILTLQSADFSKDEAIECIRLINKYVMKDPLDERELDVILREEAFKKPMFFKGSQFLFDKFARYLISECHIVKINGQLHMYREGVYVPGTSAIESQMIRFIPSLNRQKRNEVIAYIEIAIESSVSMSSANYIAFRDGIYDLDTDTFKDFSPSIIVTNKIDYPYLPDVHSEIVDRTMDKLACSDTEIRALLEEVVGYCFYRRNELRKSFILIGEKANGKSTFLDMIKTLLGDQNTSALDLKELGDRFKTAELFGKLANIGDDIGDEFIPNPAVFKKLCSGDRVNAERKGRDPFDFNNYAKLLFSANNIPRIKDKSGAVLDRLIIVPFNATFSKDDPDYDPYIKYKLHTEDAMCYLIQIGLRGLRRVLENRCFTQSEQVTKQWEEYEEANNPVITFFKETDESEIIDEASNEIYKKYNGFCIVNNFTPLSKIEFMRKLNKWFGTSTKLKKIDGKVIRIIAKDVLPR